MDATSFEMNVLLPSDPRYVGTIRELAIHAARYVGCRGADAERFGDVVAHVVLGCLTDAGNDAMPVIVRRRDGPLEVLIASEHCFEAESTRDAHISIEWTHVAGRRMCRVARSMPEDHS